MLTITPFSPRRNNSDRRQSWPAKPDILPTVRWSAGAHKGGHLLQHLTSPAHCPSPRGCLSQCHSQSTFLHQNLRQQTEDRRQEIEDRRQETGDKRQETGAVMEDLDNVRGGELLERVSVYNVGVASGPDFLHMSRPDTGHHLTSSSLLRTVTARSRFMI